MAFSTALFRYSSRLEVAGDFISAAAIEYVGVDVRIRAAHFVTDDDERRRLRQIGEAPFGCMIGSTLIANTSSAWMNDFTANDIGECMHCERISKTWMK